MKKGFTLIELLAVIAILGILVIMIIPNVITTMNDAKKQSFTSEVREIFKTVENEWVYDSIDSYGEKMYSKIKNSSCPNELNLNGRDNIEYFIKVDEEGNVTKFYVNDGTFQYSYRGIGLKLSDIDNVIQISDITNGRYMSITCTDGRINNPEPSSILEYMVGQGSGSGNSNFLNTSVLRKNIELITFTDSLEGHTENGVDCWDVSLGKNGNVLAWTRDVDNNGLYELTIGSNVVIHAYKGDYLFEELSNLTTIKGLELLNTSSITSMKFMFSNDHKLESVDLKNLKTSNVTDMSYAFSKCYALTTLDLSGWNTSKVTNMHSMFYSATSLQTVDLTSWNTSRVTDMSGLFYNNKNLSKIYAGNNFKTNSVSNDHLMFYGATPLVGGSGTVYDASQTGKTYARIDGGTSNPGYFTRK